MNIITGVWNVLLFHPILNVLLILYKNTSNLGVSIIILTLVIRTLLWPLLTSQLRWQKRMQSLKPHLEEIKKKHGHDKRKHQEEQLKLYKEHGINPAGSCSTMLIQVPVFFALYAAVKTMATSLNASSFNSILYFPFERFSSAAKINLDFLGINLSKMAGEYKINDIRHIIPYLIIAILVGITQFFYSRLTIIKPIRNEIKEEKKEKINTFNQEEFTNMLNFQTVYFIPVFLLFISYQSVPSGVSIYWIVQNIFVIIQSIILRRFERKQ